MEISDLINKDVFRQYLADEDRKTKEQVVIGFVKQGDKALAIQFLQKMYIPLGITETRFLVEVISMKKAG